MTVPGLPVRQPDGAGELTCFQEEQSPGDCAEGATRAQQRRDVSLRAQWWEGAGRPLPGAHGGDAQLAKEGVWEERWGYLPC